MENYMKLEMIGKGCGGNCVFLVKDLSDGKVTYYYILNNSNYNNNSIMQ